MDFVILVLEMLNLLSKLLKLNYKSLYKKINISLKVLSNILN